MGLPSRDIRHAYIQLYIQHIFPRSPEVRAYHSLSCPCSLSSLRRTHKCVQPVSIGLEGCMAPTAAVPAVAADNLNWKVAEIWVWNRQAQNMAGNSVQLPVLFLFTPLPFGGTLRWHGGYHTRVTKTLVNWTSCCPTWKKWWWQTGSVLGSANGEKHAKLQSRTW